MTESIVVAIITAGVTLVGVLLSNSRHSAVVDEKLCHLTNEVQKHNSIIDRTYKLEQNFAVLEQRQRVADKRIADLEDDKK